MPVNIWEGSDASVVAAALEAIAQSTGGRISSYTDLADKPQIGGVELSGNKSLDNLGIHNIPSGGTTGQVLKKTSGSNYAVEWADESGGGADIDDTAGHGATTKVWSAGKTYDTTEALSDAIDTKVPTALMAQCLEFTEHSLNLWDTDTIGVGYVLPSNGRVYDSEPYQKYRYSAKIAVTPGDVIYFYNHNGTAQSSTITCYDLSENLMGSAGYDHNAQNFTIPQGVRFVVITIHQNYLDEFMVLPNTPVSPSTFIPCESETYYVAREKFIPDGLITAEKTNFCSADGIILNLPANIYATEGIECNIYFENITEYWEKYKWDITCSKGKQFERGFKFTPASTDEGTYTLSITVENEYGAKKTVSTSRSTVMSKLNANFANDPMSITTNGTRGTSPNNHEGHSGWTVTKYFTTAQDNAFYNPTSETFDADYYFTNSGVSAPDWFFINMGINDMFGKSNDEDVATQIEISTGLIDDMIESIHDADSSIKIGVCLTIPPNHSQDAFGKEYGCGQTRNRYKRNNLLWVDALIKKYDGRTAEGIYVVPIYVALDTVYNMGFETLAVNARNTSITYESAIGNGGVHPVESGYWQIADMYTAFLKAQAE